MSTRRDTPPRLLVSSPPRLEVSFIGASQDFDAVIKFQLEAYMPDYTHQPTFTCLLPPHYTHQPTSTCLLPPNYTHQRPHTYRYLPAAT